VGVVNHRLGRCEGITYGTHRCERGAVAYLDGRHFCSNHLDERAAVKECLAWCRGLLDGSILFTGRYAQERLDREAALSALRGEQSARLSEEAEQWLNVSQRDPFRFERSR
jgi:hypothetical protein